MVWGRFLSLFIESLLAKRQRVRIQKRKRLRLKDQSPGEVIKTTKNKDIKNASRRIRLEAERIHFFLSPFIKKQLQDILCDLGTVRFLRDIHKSYLLSTCFCLNPLTFKTFSLQSTVRKISYVITQKSLTHTHTKFHKTYAQYILHLLCVLHCDNFCYSILFKIMVYTYNIYFSTTV